MGLKLRDYQSQAVKKSIEENTIVNLPTGFGKTLIAAHVIKHFATRGIVVFVVPTLELVSQQETYLKEHTGLASSDVVAVRGGASKVWEPSTWEAFRSCKVLVGVHEIIRRALDRGLLSRKGIACVIVDEAHYAIGNHPYVTIVSSLPPQVRIIGLTASYLHGSMKAGALQKRRCELENNLRGHVWSPANLPCENALEYAPIVIPREEDRSIEIDVAVLRASEALYAAARLGWNTGEEERKSKTVFEQLGEQAWTIYLCDGVMEDILFRIAQLQNESRKNPGRLQELEQERLRWIGRQFDFRSEGGDGRTQRLQKLVELVVDLYAELGKGCRCIIFVEQVCVAAPVAKVLNMELGGDLVGYATGGGSMSESKRRQYMDKFREGTLQFLVATAAMEEGIDVGDCNIVVRFDVFNNVKSHIQGKGRARKKGSRIFYFENDFETEEARAQLVRDAAARDSDVSLVGGAATAAYPRSFQDSDAILDADNALTLLYEYVAKTTKHTAAEVGLFKEEDGSICSVALPTPNGTLDISKEHVLRVWRHVAADESLSVEEAFRKVVPKERCAKLKRKQVLERVYAFAAASQLVELGHMTTRLQPSPAAITKTLTACGPFQTRPPKPQLGTRFDVLIAGGGASDGDFKSRLNVVAQAKRWPLAVYSVEQLGEQLFKASVSIGADGEAYAGGSATSKRRAEQNAAAVAIRACEAALGDSQTTTVRCSTNEVPPPAMSVPPPVGLVMGEAANCQALAVSGALQEHGNAALSQAVNYKGRLNELAMKMLGRPVLNEVVYTSNADEGYFTTTVSFTRGDVTDSVIGGSALNKKAAEQLAAQELLSKLDPDRGAAGG